jgi:hypothetical protein
MLVKVEQTSQEITHVAGIMTLLRSLYAGKVAIVTPEANAPPVCQRQLKSEFKSVEEGQKLTATMMKKNKAKLMNLFLVLGRVRNWASTQGYKRAQQPVFSGQETLGQSGHDASRKDVEGVWLFDNMRSIMSLPIGPK